MANAGTAGYSLPNYEDPLGIAANYAKVFYSSDGTPEEPNPPKPPPKAPNSSPVSQEDGSSLPKAIQGVLAKTTTDLNNLIPAHGCDIKLPALFEKIQIQFKQFLTAETNRLQEFGTWLGGAIAPIVEEIKQAVKAIKDRIKEIQKYIDKVKKIIEEIKEWITVVQEVLSFLLSLPARLLQLVANCLNALTSSLGTMFKTSLNAAGAAADANTSAGSKTNPTPTPAPTT